MTSQAKTLLALKDNVIREAIFGTNLLLYTLQHEYVNIVRFQTLRSC